MILAQTHIVFLSLLFVLYSVEPAKCVVVDGEKKKDMSASKKQSDEKEMIDPFNTKTCGLADPNYDEHEFVNMAREGQFPWLASFQITIPRDATRDKQEKAAHETAKETIKHTGKRLEDLHFCCGSFISDKWILSAAHCFAPYSIKNYLENDKLKVVAGSHKVSSRSDTNRNLTIERIFYHDQFDHSAKIGFDIALVELKHKVNFTQKRVAGKSGEQSKPFMNTICLPLKNKKYKYNSTARIAGWGLSNEKDETSMPSKLLTTDILIKETDDCVKRYEKVMKSDRPKLQHDKYDDFICASYKNARDACQSDSGGPLMQYAGGKAVVVGIVSYGIGCAKKDVPGLYTRTSAYINWIKDITVHGRDSSVGFKLIEAGQAKTRDNQTSKSTARPNKVEPDTTTTGKPKETSRQPTTRRSEQETTTTKPIGGYGGFKFFND